MSSNDEFRPIYHPKDKNYPLKLLRQARPDAPAALHQRMMYDLECQARQAILDWKRLRDGKAKKERDQERAQQLATLKEIKELDKYLKTVREQLTRRFGHLLFIRNVPLKLQVNEAIDGLEAASAAAWERHRVHSKRPISEAKVAKEILEDFLVVATVIWCQVTGKRPTLGKHPETGKPSTPCAEYMNSAAQPLIARLKADGAVLTATWPSVYRRLSALFPKLEPSLGERILGIDIEMEKAKKRKQKQIGKAS